MRRPFLAAWYSIHPIEPHRPICRGPDDCGQGLHWELSGKVGDIFKITFQHLVRRGEDLPMQRHAYGADFGADHALKSAFRTGGASVGS